MNYDNSTQDSVKLYKRNYFHRQGEATVLEFTVFYH